MRVHELQEPAAGEGESRQLATPTPMRWMLARPKALLLERVDWSLGRVVTHPNKGALACVACSTLTALIGGSV